MNNDELTFWQYVWHVLFREHKWVFIRTFTLIGYSFNTEGDWYGCQICGVKKRKNKRWVKQREF